MSFVGTTIIYAYMQTIGMVNDHKVDCYKVIRSFSVLRPAFTTEPDEVSG